MSVAAELVCDMLLSDLIANASRKNYCSHVRPSAEKASEVSGALQPILEWAFSLLACLLNWSRFVL